MAWTIEYSNTARRSLQRLDPRVAKRVMDFMKNRVATAENPRQLGIAMVGDEGSRWRYRIGDYRAICGIQDDKIRILVLDVGHRREVYRRK